MNNLKKIGLTALAGSLVATASFGAELSVSGGAALYFDQPDNVATKGNSFYMGDSVTFSGSGEMDNGMTISVSYELDQGAADGTNGTFDSHSMTLDTGSAGTITFAGHGGSTVLSSMDDVTPTAYEESWDIVTGADTSVINGVSGNNSFLYKSPVAQGAQFMIAYINASDAVTDVSYSDYGFTFAPESIDGLSLGYATGDDESTKGTVLAEKTMYAKYVYGAATLGYQKSQSDSSAANSDKDTVSVGVTYAVSDDLSVGYNMNTVDFESASSVDQESTGFSISYTMGSISLSGAMNKVDNIAGVETTDREGYEFGLAFAF
jgi:outer membrane protein OmpU